MACLHHHKAIFVLCMSLYKFPSYKDTSHWIRTHLIHHNLILAETLLPNIHRFLGDIIWGSFSTQYSKALSFYVFVTIGKGIYM